MFVEKSCAFSEVSNLWLVSCKSFNSYLSEPWFIVYTFADNEKNQLLWQHAEEAEFKFSLQVQSDYVEVSNTIRWLSGKQDLLARAQRIEIGEVDLLESAMFLKKNIPCMLAKRVKDLEALPLPFQESGSISEIAGFALPILRISQTLSNWFDRLYKDSFVRILSAPDPKDIEVKAFLWQTWWVPWFSFLCLNKEHLSNKLTQVQSEAGFSRMLAHLKEKHLTVIPSVLS